MNIACGKCFFFESSDNEFATISYGLCKVLKMAVYKDAVEDCPHGKASWLEEAASIEEEDYYEI